jgi:hypothetical protein
MVILETYLGKKCDELRPSTPRERTKLAANANRMKNLQISHLIRGIYADTLPVSAIIYLTNDEFFGMLVLLWQTKSKL